MQLPPQRDRARSAAAGEEHRLGAALDDLFDLAREHRAGVHVATLSCAGDGDPRLFGVAGDDLRQRDLERVLVVEHVHACARPARASARPARRPRPGRPAAAARTCAARSDRSVRGSSWPASSEEVRPDVGARRADLQDARGVDQRQRDGGRGRVVVAEVGDRARVLRRRLGVGRGHARVHSPLVGLESSSET